LTPKAEHPQYVVKSLQRLQTPSKLFRTIHQILHNTPNVLEAFPVMNPFAKIFELCCSNREDPTSHEEVELDTLEPELIPTPAPTHYPLAHLPRYRHPTLAPRMLAPLSKTADFADGGDARRPLATFSAHWADTPEDSQSVVYEFVYEGECGRTWPLSRVRVDDRVEKGEREEEEEEVYEEYEGHVDAAELNILLDEKELEATIDDDIVRVLRPTHVEMNDETVRIFKAIHATTNNSSAKASGPVQETTDDNMVRMTGPIQEASTLTEDVLKKMRIRIRRSTANGNDDTEKLPVKRFKLRIRVPQESEDESMRHLPTRQGALLVTNSSDGDSRQGAYGVLVRKAATVPCCATSGVVKKDSARNSSWRRIL
jgi:hypothetical protein